MSGPKAMPDRYADFTLEELQTMVDKGELNPIWLENYKKRRAKKELFGEPAAPTSATKASPHQGDLDTAMKVYNERFAVVTDNGKTQVHWMHEDRTRTVYLTNNDFFGAWANEKLIITSETPNHNQTSKQVEAAKHWYYNFPGRRTCHYVIFDPKGSAPPHTLNYWPGFGVNIAKVDDVFLEWYDKWKLVIDFINDIICSGDDASYEYLKHWIGHVLQRPWEKPEVSIVLIGTKGTGKSLFAKFLERLIDGARKYCLYYKTVKEKDFTGNFNDHLRHKLLLIIDEASLHSSAQCAQRHQRPCYFR